MQASYADLLKDLASQYNGGRISFEHFRRARHALISEAEAQYLGLSPIAASAPSTPPSPADDDDITAIQYPQ